MACSDHKNGFRTCFTKYDQPKKNKVNIFDDLKQTFVYWVNKHSGGLETARGCSTKDNEVKQIV